MGGLLGVHSWLQSGFFQEIAPAFMPVFWTLAIFEHAHGCRCGLPALRDLNDSSGFVSADVMPNDSVASLGFLVCQMGSVLRISSIRDAAFSCSAIRFKIGAAKSRAVFLNHKSEVFSSRFKATERSQLATPLALWLPRTPHSGLPAGS